MLFGMIKTFRCNNTQALFETGKTRRFSAFKAAAERKLVLLQAAEALEDLRSPPGNRLEALSGDREGQHSLRINRQWRVCFRWTEDGAEDVEIVDYH
jgi:proteic killer suppression protein